MRAAHVILLAVCGLAYGKVADKKFLDKQLDILRLLQHVNQPSFYPDFNEISFKFKWDYSQWSKPEHAKEFQHYYQHDILPQGEIFSVFHPKHLRQAIALYRTLYYAKDYATFLKVAAWARQNVNGAMFVYALTIAVIHSPHCSGVLLPPLQEVRPHYFFGDEVIGKAQRVSEVHANYSGWYLNLGNEQAMSYFMEDVGINAYYYYCHVFNPFWMSGEEMVLGDYNRGEYYYWHHQQILARFYLERLSNSLGEIKYVDYRHPVETGFEPSLRYANGLPFPSRPNHAVLRYRFVNNTPSVERIEDFERRLRDAVDLGEDDFDTLGNKVEANLDSPNSRYYGNIEASTRKLLGYSLEPSGDYKLVPSALEHFETSMRDPGFYQMYKRLMGFFHQHQNYQGPYGREKLEFAGIKITNLKVDRLTTHVELHASDITNALSHFEQTKVEAIQRRLNHKPYNVSIAVSSNQATDAMIKIFIGPKYDEFGREITLDKNRLNFFELDKFHYKLKKGSNVITRNSHDSVFFSEDIPTYQTLMEQVQNALEGREDFEIHEEDFYYGFPNRYMLPKGYYGGKKFQLYVIVSPYHRPKKVSALTKYVVDSEYSAGYPFDRPIEIEDDFLVDNSKIMDVKVYFEGIIQ